MKIIFKLLFQNFRFKNLNQKYVNFVGKYLKRMLILKDTKEHTLVINLINVTSRIVTKLLPQNVHLNIIQSLIWVKWNELCVPNVTAYLLLHRLWKFICDSIQVNIIFYLYNYIICNTAMYILLREYIFNFFYTRWETVQVSCMRWRISNFWSFTYACNNPRTKKETKISFLFLDINNWVIDNYFWSQLNFTSQLGEDWGGHSFDNYL